MHANLLKLIQTSGAWRLHYKGQYAKPSARDMQLFPSLILPPSDY